MSSVTAANAAIEQLAIHGGPKADIYGDGKPTQQVQSGGDVRCPLGSLPVSEGAAAQLIHIPWFKHDRPEIIEQYADAYRKVALQAETLVQ